MEELLEELGDKVIKCKLTAVIIVDGKKISPKEIRQLRKAFDEEGIDYNLTVKGSGE